jgi:hypothetical protein
MPVPQNKRMKLTSLSAAPGWLQNGRMEAPPRAPEGRTDGRTGSQLIRSVRRTLEGAMKTDGALMIAIPLSAMTTGTPTRPKVPYTSRDACPGECCEYGGIWTAKADTEVRARPRLDSPVAFRLRKGDTVLAVTGMVVTTRLGRAVVRRPIRIGDERRLKAGPADEVVVLYRRGEGSWRIWLRGELDDAELPTEDDRCATDGGEPVECEVQIVVRPQTVWWSRVRTRNGREGWTHQMKHFAGVYTCGE